MNGNSPIVDTLAGGIVFLCLLGALYAAYPVQVKLIGGILIATWLIGRGIEWLMGDSP